MENSFELKKGYGYSIQAYIAWGILPIYWKLIDTVPASEILAHRILWSFVFLFIVLRSKSDFNLKSILNNKKLRNSLIVSSIMIGINWGLYIYAVNNDRIIEASMGYYINPLVSIFLAMVFLKERLDKLKIIALIFAVLGVLYTTIHYGKFPWIAMYLAFSFGFYGLLKKTTKLDSLRSLTVETLFLAPFSLLFIVFKGFKGTGQISTGSIKIDILLIVAGIVTTMPLLWFSKGAKRIPLTSVGFLQYIAPSLMLILGIFVYKEKFTKEHFVSFGLIWIALILYSISLIRSIRKN